FGVAPALAAAATRHAGLELNGWASDVQPNTRFHFTSDRLYGLSPNAPNGRAMERMIKAWQNSVRAFRRLLRSETAFQQELMLLALAVPLAWFLSSSWRGYALLVGAIL